ncbi:hypothetical protein HU200_047327 [Digitaria exilis]|uniref:WRKY domain-containing protein n=1 Tax=Digitaria exilis TaxID=1010633 RepID=A0A835B350_9POAL|nr:hypothetical protein HU200_047327 [Digitaria exilis]
MEGMPEEKCALVAELMRVLERVRQLEAHMASQHHHQQQGGGGGGGGAAAGGDHRSRALVCTMRESIDRAMRMAMSCCANGRAAIAGQPDSPPSGGDGSPRSGGSDQAGDFRGRGNAAGQCKKSTQVRVSAVQDVTPLDDGLSWRNTQGQRRHSTNAQARTGDADPDRSSPSYFRCTHRHTQSCHASKQVQRTDGDPLLFDVVYHGHHTCAQAQGAAAVGNQLAPGAEPSHAAAAAAAGPVLQFSLPSNKPAAVATASPFASPATPECLAARDVPRHDVELVSATNSPMGAMGEMDFMFTLDAADFLENPASYF